MYEIIKTVFDGNADTVIIEVMDMESSKKYILKAVRPGGKPVQVRREMTFLPMLKHDNIIKHRDVVSVGKYEGILLDRAVGGDLLEMVKSCEWLEESVVKNIARSLVSALCHVHNIGVIHRDVKLDNILIMESGNDFNGCNVVLADFGCASYDGCCGLSGTSDYAAPEVNQGRSYDASVDMWSLGVTLFTALVGELPFDDVPESADHVFIPYIDDVSDECRDFIGSLLKFCPSERLSADQAMKHAWFA